MSITNTEVVAQFGAFYENNGQNAASIKHQLYTPYQTESAFTLTMTENTVWKASKAEVDYLVQPWQPGWTPSGGLTLTPIEIGTFKMKVDQEYAPHELDDTYHGFLMGEEIDPAEWPFIRWLIEVHLIPKIHENIELKEIFNGVHAAPSPGTPGAVGTSMDGINKIINDHIAAGRITPIVTGAPPTDPAQYVQQVEDFVDAINERYQGIPMELCMSYANRKRFLRGYRKLYGKDTDYKSNENGQVDFTMVNIMPLRSMMNSNKIFCTPKENARLIKQRGANMGRVRVESRKRNLDVFTDWRMGVGFSIPEIVFVNDQ